MKISWHDEAWSDYLYWQEQDKRTIKRINMLIKDIMRNPYEGTGKPEPLKHGLRQLWSRRIDEQNRLVYLVENNEVFIFQCRTHYNKI